MVLQKPRGPGRVQGHGQIRPHPLQSVAALAATPAADNAITATGNYPQAPLRRGKSLLAREEDVPESGLSLFKRGATLRRRNKANNARVEPGVPAPKRGCFDNIGPGPKDAWFIYCYLLTACVPPFVLSSFGIKTPEQQRAWREKIGLLSGIALLMAGVGFLTFGFTQTVCGKPPDRFMAGTVGAASVIIHGYDYDFGTFQHPAVGNTFDGKSNPLFEGGWNAGGKDLSFLFQRVNQNCRGVVNAAPGSVIPNQNGDLQWYFPCQIVNQFGTTGVNKTGYENKFECHVQPRSRQQLEAIVPAGQVFYNWGNVSDTTRNLAVYEQCVFGLLRVVFLD